MSVLVTPTRAAIVKAAVQAYMATYTPPSPDEIDDSDKRHWRPMDYQQLPPGEDWDLWLLIGGRGIGKTDTMAHHMNTHALGPACDNRIPGGHRMGIVAPTLGDAVDACVNGPTGLKAHNPMVRIRYGIGGAYAVWPHGATAKLFSTENSRTVDRLRAGGNRCMDWWEEFAAWPLMKEAYDQAVLGLRSGPWPHAVASTTPRPRPKLIDLIADERTRVAKTKDGRTPTTDDNPHLPGARRAEYYRLYAGTRLGRQELGGEILMDIEGALWRRESIDRNRLRVKPDMRRIVVAVDPSGGKDVDNDEQGIVVAGVGDCPVGMESVHLPDGGSLNVADLPHAFILDDLSCKLDPDGWGRQAVRAYLDWKADVIVVESNFGGDMARSTITNAARSMGVSVNCRVIHASRGKQVRAEPVAALYPQQRVHHVTNGNGHTLAELEDQLCTWTRRSPGSPDRLDALVWAVWELMLKGQEVRFY